MLLFCGGGWPIRKISPILQGLPKNKNVFCHSTSGEEDTIFSEIRKLESAFVEIFNIDSLWKNMDDNELSNRIGTIRSDGMSIMEMSDIWEKKMSNNEE